MRVIFPWLLLLLQLACSSSPPSSLTIAWDPSTSPGIVGYNVYRKGDTDKEYVKVNQTPIPEPKYTDTSVESDKTYFYRVTAVASSGQESGMSNEISAQAK